MIPDPLIYTGTATFLVGVYTVFQSDPFSPLLLFGASTLAFAARIELDREDHSVDADIERSGGSQ